MRPLPEPMDGTGARRSRSTDDTGVIPRLVLPDPDEQGRYEKAWREQGEHTSEPGWYERVRADVARENDEMIGQAPRGTAADRHLSIKEARPGRHQAARDDLPGPSRRELARLIRQVRALTVVLLALFVGLHAYTLYDLIFR